MVNDLTLAAKSEDYLIPQDIEATFLNYYYHTYALVESFVKYSVEIDDYCRRRARKNFDR